MAEKVTFEQKLEDAAKQGVKVVDLQFHNVFGRMKLKSVSFEEFMHEKEYIHGYGVDGSSIGGYGVPVEESDMLIMPDPKTFHIIPWAKDVSRVICDVHTPASGKISQQPFEGDPRVILKKMCNTAGEILRDEMKIKADYFQYHVAPELEFFVVDKNFQRIDNLGYFDAPPHRMREFLTNIMEAMKTMGIKYETYHTEVAPSQYEFDFRYGEAVEIADAALTLKDIIRNYAEKHDVIPLFMAKPFYGMNGSGMHCHLNLSAYSGEDQKKKKTNLFQGTGNGDLSKIALYFIAGLLKHAPAITAITNPTCNSYKRIVPGWEAPVNIAWGRKNRTALIRVPYGNPKAARAEYRSPDPACNPYLAFTVTLAAGMDGIVNRIKPPKPTEIDLFHGNHGVAQLPGSLDEALDHLENDDVIKKALGPQILSNFISAKRKESQLYRMKPSNIDFEMYSQV
jgi:glutamine synthetase